MTEFRNPTPVVVGLVFPKPSELVLITRAIKGEASFGKEALPGGYVELHQTWQEALRDEIDQEAHIEVSIDHMEPYDFRSTPDKSRILLFAIIRQDGVKTVRPYKPTDETSARRMVGIGYWKQPTLCFPLHNQVLTRYVDEFCTDEAQNY